MQRALPGVCSCIQQSVECRRDNRGGIRKDDLEDSEEARVWREGEFPGKRGL